MTWREGSLQGRCRELLRLFHGGRDRATMRQPGGTGGGQGAAAAMKLSRQAVDLPALWRTSTTVQGVGQLSAGRVSARDQDVLDAGGEQFTRVTVRGQCRQFDAVGGEQMQVRPELAQSR